MPVRICLAGITGNVGRCLAEAIQSSEDFVLTGAVSCSHAGKRVSDLISGYADDLRIDSISKALQSADVFIDYTTPAAVKRHVHEAIGAGVHAVIGTSGLTDAEYEEIDALARKHGVGVFAAGNFSLTAALMQHFACLAVRHIPYWEIFDYAPSTKPDAPSGTTRELSHMLARIGTPKLDIPVDKIDGVPETRGGTVNASQIHSVRVPGFYSSSEILFGLPGERLTLRHDSISPHPYVEGTLLAARQVTTYTGLKRGLATLLNL